MKRGLSPGVSSSLEAALDKARSLISSTSIDSRSPSMQVPTSAMGVNASDAAIELPDIVERNNAHGFYPAQDGYARNPQSEQEIQLARGSQYGTDWGRQKRQNQILLDKDPVFRFVKAIAGATQRPIDRFVQGPNQEVIDIERQRAFEQARREIAIYGPDFQQLEARIASLVKSEEANEKRQSDLKEALERVNRFMEGEYTNQYEFGNAAEAKRSGNWWVLPSEIRSLQAPQYSSISIDLEKLFAGDSPVSVSVYDYAMIPRSVGRGFRKDEKVTGGTTVISVIPYVYAVYTRGVMKKMKSYLDEGQESVLTMSVRQLLMMAFLLMNGGSYSPSAYDQFEEQVKACDPDDIQSITEQSQQRKALMMYALENWYNRATDKTGDLNIAIRATLSLNYTDESANPVDDSLFYGVSGTDSVFMYRNQQTVNPPTDIQKKLIDALEAVGSMEPTNANVIGPITLRELCKQSNTVPGKNELTELYQKYLVSATAFLSEITKSFEVDHSANLFQALLYFAGYFTGFSGLQTLDDPGIVKEMRKILNVTKLLTTRSVIFRSIIEIFPEPVSPFKAKNNLDQVVKLSETNLTISDVVHLKVFASSVRKDAIEKINDVTQEANNTTRAIQAAQQRLIDMTHENYDTINRHADKLIMADEIDTTPSLYSMGNSIDYATKPQNIGLIVLTPLAHYGIWVSYEVLQDRNIPNNRVAGLPFDKIIRDTSMSIFFAKFVSALLANTGLATGAGYQAQVRSARIPYELQSAATAIFSFAYSVVRRDPLTGVFLDKPRFKIYRQTAHSGRASYLVY